MTWTQADDELGARLRRALGPQHPVAAVATVDGDRVTVAAVGAPVEGDFEIGSVSKGVTGLLYADALERGELGPGTTLGEVLPLGASPASGVTLQSLSTHSSGLPRLPRSAKPLRRTLRLWRSGTAPYGETLEELLQQAGGVRLARRARPRYSNLGFELLGHAVARAAGMSYQQLLRERLTAPLGLESVYAPSTSEQLRATAVQGRDRRGRVVEAWTGEGVAPAGGIRAAVGDLGTLARALLDRSAPGVAALDPVATFTRTAQIGAGWVTVEVDGRQITWHNGGTGGFRSWMGLDRQAGTGVVLLSASAVPVDHHGFAMLQRLDR